MNYELRFVGQYEGSCETFPVSVPGNIQKDYAQSHGFVDWQFGANCKKFDEIEDKIWIYSATFHYTKSEEKVYFVTDGIDYACQCFIGETMFFQHEGMFEGFEKEITDFLTEGENTLRIRILPPPKSTDLKCRVQANHSVKPMAAYGFDWHPRLIPSGLWQGVTVESRKNTDFAKPQLRYDLFDDFSKAIVYVEAHCDAPILYTLKDADGTVAAESTNGVLTVENPNLWWCRGQGEQYLYTWEVASATCSYSGKIGFRKAELTMNPGTWEECKNIYPGSRARPPMTLTLNGRSIFAKGSNFVVPDVFTGSMTAERYRELVDLAADANMNILRMWGGAGVQKECFFDICDEKGILIWQEFPLASNHYGNDGDYLAVLEQEARAIVRKLRHHPSVVIWCGGNELFQPYVGMTDQSHALRLLNKICYEENREVPFLPTSPIQGVGHGHYLFFAAGMEVYEMFNAAHKTAYVEFGVAALSPYPILKDIIPKEELSMPHPSESWTLHHAFDAMGAENWANLDVLRRYFGELTTTEQCCRYGNWLQCEGYKAIFEEARRQKPYCSMALNWDYNEPWVSAAGNSLLNYPARPKPCYYAVKSSLRDTMASARIHKFTYKCGEEFTAEIWLLNDANAEVQDDISVELTLADHTYHILDISDLRADVRANCKGPTIRFVLPYAENTESFDLVLTTKKYGESRYTLQYVPCQPN